VQTVSNSSTCARSNTVAKPLWESILAQHEVEASTNHIIEYRCGSFADGYGSLCPQEGADQAGDVAQGTAKDASDAMQSTAKDVSEQAVPTAKQVGHARMNH